MNLRCLTPVVQPCLVSLLHFGVPFGIASLYCLHLLPIRALPSEVAPKIDHSGMAQSDTGVRSRPNTQARELVLLHNEAECMSTNQKATYLIYPAMSVLQRKLHQL